jgi:hypothetical protein
LIQTFWIHYSRRLIMTLIRLLCTGAAVTVSVLAILTTTAVFAGALWKFWYIFLILLLIPGVPNPFILVTVPWSWTITHSLRLFLGMRVELIESLNLEPGRPIILACNHPPSAFFPVLMWTMLWRLWKFPAGVSKAGNLVNLFGLLVIVPSLLMKAIIVTVRGRGWGAKMVGWFTRKLITRWSMLYVFIDVHRPESRKAQALYRRMVETIPQIAYHQRIGVYFYGGLYEAMRARPDALVLAVTMSYPEGAVGFRALWRIWRKTIYIQMVDVTGRLRSSMGERLQDSKPVRFMEVVNNLSTEADRFMVEHHPSSR